MTHLRIIQNNGVTEEVSSSVIQKLYELATSDDPNNIIVLEGRINAPSAKISHVNYFMPQSGQKPYPEFYVTAAILGLDFEDPEVERICVERWGSNGIINIQQMQAVHYLNNYGNNRPFSNNTTITKFNEFQYFTGLVNDDMNGASTGWVFYGCSNLSEITLPDNIPCIGVNMFVGCTSLTSITIPNSVRNVFNDSFSGCTNLQSLTFTGLTGRCSLGTRLNSLTSLTLNEGTTQLSLTNSESLTTLTLPSTVTQLSLSENRSLRTLILSPNHTHIELQRQGLGDDVSLQEIRNVRPDTFTFGYGQVGGFGYVSIPTLDIVAPEGCTMVDTAGFYHSHLHSVDLPSTITRVAFRGMESGTFTRLIFRSINPPTLDNEYVLDGSYNNHNGCPIYVPDASVESYKTASNEWQVYAARIKKLSPLEVMNGLRSDVPAECFKDDTNITASDFTNSNITSIDHDAFAGCTSLTTLDTSNCTSIGYGAFNGCTSLQSIDISSVTTGATSVFNNCSSLTSLGTGNAINCATVENNMFRNCSSLTSVNITSATKIGTQAFQNCSLLATVTLNSGLTTIGQYAFDGCASLTTIDLSNVTTINERSFRNCTGLTTITLSNSLTIIPNYCFSGDTALTTINGGTGITIINEGAFLGCSNLIKTFDFTNTLSIAREAFKNCSKCTFTNFDNVSSFGSNCLQGCTISGSYSFKDGVSIGWESFKETSIQGVHFLGSGTLSHSAFGRCRQLTSIVFDGDVKLGAACFNNCTNLQSVDLSNISNASLNDSSTGYTGGQFSECSSLSQIILNPNITTIPQGFAAYNNSVPLSITIPASVTSIGAGAFYATKVDMTILATTPPAWGNDTSLSGHTVSIKVPNGCLSTYQSASGWSTLANKMSELPA